MNLAEQHQDLDYGHMNVPNVSGEVLENIRDAIVQILDGKYSIDEEKIAKTTRNLTDKILKKSNGLEEIQKKYENMKPKRIAKEAAKARIDTDILSCITIAFQTGRKNSLPLKVLYIIFQKLGEAYKDGCLLYDSLVRLKDFTRGAVKTIERKNKKKNKKSKKK